MSSDIDTINHYWHHFVQVRVCPHCGYDHWTARLQVQGTHRRWIYHCQDCWAYWGNYQPWWPPIPVVTRKKWGL